MTTTVQGEAPTRAVVRDGGTSLAEQLFASVKREIVEHRLPAETILAETTLADRYGVSRAPAREALKRLATLRYVRVVPRVGYIVTGVSLRDFDEIFALRFVLEPLAVELAVPRLGEADGARLETLARRVLEIPASSPREEHGALLTQVNADFHREIARLTANLRLERTIGGLIDELERFMYLLAYSDSVSALLDQHLTLIDTMRSGDAATAGLLMRDQLSNDFATIRELLLQDASALKLAAPSTTGRHTA